MKLFTLLFIVIFISACGETTNPAQVYEEYNEKVKQGLSFELEKLYFTKKKNKEVDEQIEVYMKSMNKTEKEVIEFYSKFSKSVAKCSEIKLLNQNITKEFTELIYELEDLCNENSNGKGLLKVRMVEENGWKIDEIKIEL